MDHDHLYLSLGDSLHEISKAIFREKKKNIISLSSAEIAQRVVKGKYNKRLHMKCEENWPRGFRG